MLVAGPQTGKLIENTVVALSHGKNSPSFIAIDQAEGIGKRTPPYDSLDVPAGAFGGVPPVPDDELKSLTFPLYLVARKNFNEDKIAAFSKVLYSSRQALAYASAGHHRDSNRRRPTRTRLFWSTPVPPTILATTQSHFSTNTATGFFTDSWSAPSSVRVSSASPAISAPTRTRSASASCIGCSSLCARRAQ